MKEFLYKELSLIIMQYKLKLNTFLKKLRKLSFNMSQSKESGREFNIYLWKPKLSTTLKEKDTLLDQDMSTDRLFILEVLIMLEVKLIVTLQEDILIILEAKLIQEDYIQLEVNLNM